MLGSKRGVKHLAARVRAWLLWGNLVRLLGSGHWRSPATSASQCRLGKVGGWINQDWGYYRRVGWRVEGAFLVAQTVKKLPAMQKTWVRSLGREEPLEAGMTTHSSILAWRIPWTEETGGLQSTGSQSGTREWLTLSLSRLEGEKLKGVGADEGGVVMMMKDLWWIQKEMTTWEGWPRKGSENSGLQILVKFELSVEWSQAVMMGSVGQLVGRPEQRLQKWWGDHHIRVKRGRLAWRRQSDHRLLEARLSET